MTGYLKGRYNPEPFALKKTTKQQPFVQRKFIVEIDGQLTVVATPDTTRSFNHLSNDDPYSAAKAEIPPMHERSKEQLQDIIEMIGHDITASRVI